MKVLDPGHEYLLEPIPVDSEPPVRIHFPKREGANYPGNVGEHPGPLTQEYLRAVIDRAKYMNAQGPCAETDNIISCLRQALMWFEVRAARCRGASIYLSTVEAIEAVPTCPICGHIQCDIGRHDRIHWSENYPIWAHG